MENKKNIKILAMGGTIDKTYKSQKGTRNLSFGEPAAHKISEKVGLNISTESIYKIDSLDMTQEHRDQLLDRIQNTSAENIIITHGTDTMIETGEFLQDAELQGKTIILTGASIPYKFRESDAELNLGSAIAAVQLVNDKVRVAIHGEIHNPKESTKMEDGSFKSTSNLTV